MIDPSPQRQVKEGRNIDTASADSPDPRLSAVNHPDSPDVLTNDPQFFTKRPPIPYVEFVPENAGYSYLVDWGFHFVLFIN